MAYLLSTLLIFCTSVFINLLPEKKSLTAFLLGMYITSHANIILSGLILGLFERLSSQTGFLFLEALFLLLTLAVSFKVRANLKWKSSLVDLSAQAGGSALRAFLHAMKLKSDILVKVDGDGQMPLERLPALLDAIIDDGYDMAKGNRFLSAENLASMPRHRIFGNIVSTFLTKMATGYWHIFDPQNGFIALRAESLGKINTQKIHCGFFFENDLLFHMKLIDARVKDVAMPTVYGEEESDIKVSRIMLTFPGLLFNRWVKRIYAKYILTDFSPIAIFLIVGTLMFLGGFLFGAAMWIKGVVTNTVTTTGTIMLSVLPLILGFQLLLQSVVMDIHENERYK